MVFVPWRQLCICPFWAMHKTECKYGELCRWAHPPQEQVKRIWDWYTVQQATNAGAGTGLDYGALKSSDLKDLGRTPKDEADDESL